MLEINRQALIDLVTNFDIGANTLRLFCFLLAHTDDAGRVDNFTQVELADQLSMQQGNIHRAIMTLRQMELIKQATNDDGHSLSYQVNSKFFN